VTGIEEIKNAVVSLPVNEYRKFRDWFLERDWEEWDKQIEADSRSGNWPTKVFLSCAKTHDILHSISS